jgi:hypothetical protein
VATITVLFELIRLEEDPKKILNIDVTLKARVISKKIQKSISTSVGN